MPCLARCSRFGTRLLRHIISPVSLAFVPRTAREFNLRIAPVLSYVGQLVAPTTEVVSACRSAANRLLHLPHNCLPLAVWRKLDDLGMVQPRMVDTAAWAAMASARKRLAPFWRYGAQILKLAAEEGAMLAQLNDARAEPLGWAAPAFAHSLEAPFAEAPLEVQRCAPTLARRDEPADEDTMFRDLYAKIRAADPEAAASALALRARFIVLLDGAG